MTQVLLTSVFYLWLFAMLVLIWRHALGGGKHVQRLQGLLNDNARLSAQAALQAAEAARLAAEAAQKLAGQGTRHDD